MHPTHNALWPLSKLMPLPSLSFLQVWLKLFALLHQEIPVGFIQFKSGLHVGKCVVWTQTEVQLKTLTLSSLEIWEFYFYWWIARFMKWFIVLMFPLLGLVPSITRTLWTFDSLLLVCSWVSVADELTSPRLSWQVENKPSPHTPILTLALPTSMCPTAKKVCVEPICLAAHVSRFSRSHVFMNSATGSHDGDTWRDLSCCHV